VYAQFFGLHKLPFRLRPDPEFLYPGTDYLRARGRLMHSLKSHHRVVLLLGHGGLGKTMLLDDMLKELGADCACCRINQPHISANELLEALVLQLGSSIDDGTPHPSRSHAELVAGLESIGRRSSAPLLIVDDAHLLPPSAAMALVEILTRAHNIKIVLSGRSGLGLEEMAMRFLSGETPQIVRLQPLSPAETRSYIDHRLKVGGGGNRELIAAEAYRFIADHTGGVPRLINVLCDAALHAASLRASGQLDAAEILLATQDSRWPDAVARDRPGAGREPTPPVGGDDSIPLTSIQAQMVVAIGDETLSTWPLPPGRVRIGRASDNELRLETQFISRHHCQVFTVGSVSTIEDLGSVNGIAVNGRLVKQHVLQHADRVQLGDHTLTYLQG
jgi:type II secretory pathway predicted ATPase ExeA